MKPKPPTHLLSPGRSSVAAPVLDNGIEASLGQHAPDTTPIQQRRKAPQSGAPSSGTQLRKALGSAARANALLDGSDATSSPQHVPKRLWPQTQTPGTADANEVTDVFFTSRVPSPNLQNSAAVASSADNEVEELGVALSAADFGQVDFSNFSRAAGAEGALGRPRTATNPHRERLRGSYNKTTGTWTEQPPTPPATTLPAGDYLGSYADALEPDQVLGELNKASVQGLENTNDTDQFRSLERNLEEVKSVFLSSPNRALRLKASQTFLTTQATEQD